MKISFFWVISLIGHRYQAVPEALRTGHPNWDTASFIIRFDYMQVDYPTLPRYNFISWLNLAHTFCFFCRVAASSNKAFKYVPACGLPQKIEDMDIPGFKLHGLKSQLKGRWSIWVSGNWRITFEFRDSNAFVLDYEDYH